MTAVLGRRRPEAVKELEALQQQERTGAGESPLTQEAFLKKLHEDVQMDLISRRLDAGGLSDAIAGAAEDEALASEQVASMLAAWHLDDPTQWSQYEAPGMRSGIADICARIEEVFARRQWRLPELPVVGTLTTGQVSACTQMTASGAPLVLVYNGFFKFAGIMSQLSIFAPYDAAVRQQFTDGTLQLVCDLTATHTVLNTCLFVARRTTPPQFERRVADLVDAIATFVIAHEYAHITAGDPDAHPLDGRQARSALRSKEFDADRAGFITALEAARDPSAAAFGPFIYFAGLDLLDRAAAAYSHQPATAENSADGYPTPFERTVQLLKWIETSADASRHADTVREAAAAYNIILGAWDQILPVFWHARDAMAQFSPHVNPEGILPEARTFGLVTTLWERVKAQRSAQGV